MRVSYDEKTDTLTVILQDNTPVAESDEDKPGIIPGLRCDGQFSFLGDPRRFKTGYRDAEDRVPNDRLDRFPFAIDRSLPPYRSSPNDSFRSSKSSGTTVMSSATSTSCGSQANPSKTLTICPDDRPS